MKLVLDFLLRLFGRRDPVELIKEFRELDEGREKRIRRLEQKQLETDEQLTHCMEHHRECDEHRLTQQREINDLQRTIAQLQLRKA